MSSLNCVPRRLGTCILVSNRADQTITGLMSCRLASCWLVVRSARCITRTAYGSLRFNEHAQIRLWFRYSDDVYYYLSLWIGNALFQQQFAVVYRGPESVSVDDVHVLLTGQWTKNRVLISSASGTS